MSSTRQNKVVTITNDEVYDLAGHLVRFADSIRVVIPVNTVGERDALTKYTGLLVQRLDIGGLPIEVWNGTVWRPQAGALGAPIVLKTTTNSGVLTSGFTVVNNVASFAFLAGRKYRLRWDFSYQISIVNSGANVLIALAAVGASPTDTVAVTQLNSRRVYAPTTGEDHQGHVEAWYEPVSDDTRQVKWIANCPAANLLFTAAATTPNLFTIEDMGWQG